ncbi:hypothetical protein HYC85_006301 [Camellia sinensis]|uniref:NB-ARC domain-containing protein n=1 Tax=Camellia sinensis TaxID=4442 RepID=A0A7J7HLL5_CAMSI|nr:hypothetical protein HYC85_006301 [Camellia sinensis]
MGTELHITISLLSEKLQNLLVLAKGRFLIFPGLRKSLRVTINELKLILSFLEVEAENNTSCNNSLKARLLPTVYFAEHITDVFLLNANRTRRRSDGVSAACQIILQKPLMVFPPRRQVQFTTKMKKIVNHFRASYGEFADRLEARIAHDLTTNTTLEFDHHTLSRAIKNYRPDNDIFVGREDAEKEIVARLIDENEKSLRVISLVGEEAIGKTTLARKVYNRLDIRQHFQSRAWLHVPKEFSYKDVLLVILRQTPNLLKDIELMKENELSVFLFKILMELRFLIVLDDICTTDDWLKFVSPFADAENGSRVIITTRHSKVASEVDPWSHPLNLMQLTEEDTWALFLDKAEPDNSSHNNLNNVKAEILRLCRGLPMAIVLLGGLLSTVELSEWSTVIDHLLAQDHHFLKCIVDLSYEKLSSRLKLCFLYLAMFPKSYEIPTRRLLQLWVAEGFVQTSNEPSIDSQDMAMTCLKELERRNMIEIAERKSDGSPKTCRMPCFLYNIFLPKAEDIGFLHVHRLNSDCTVADSHIIRRIADQFLGVKSTSESHTQNLCSYVSFEAQKRVTSNTKIGNLLNSVVNKGKSFVPLKVLDLEGVYKPWLPEKLGQYLKNLRYIGLRWTGLYTCPESIGDLQCLETLDLKYTNITALPSSIWKAKSLRHLYMTGVSIRKPSSKESLTSTSKLETLTGLLIGSKEESDKENDNYRLDRFTGLKKLGLTCHSKSVDKTVECISRLDKLETLKLRSRDLPFGQPSDLVLSPLKDHQTLSKLHLFGLIKDGIHNLPLNLKILTLSMSGLRKDSMRVLGKLPRLNILNLFTRAYVGEKIRCLSGEFLELRVLKLWKLEDLRQWTVRKGALPQLVELEIRGCDNLENLEGLKELPELKELILTNMPQEFVADLREKLDRDRDIVVTNEWKISTHGGWRQIRLQLADELLESEDNQPHF